MNTLVYHAGALGDFMTVLPALRHYRRLLPRARLVFLGKKPMGELGTAAGYFDAFLDLDSSRYAPLFRPDDTGTLPRQAGSFDTAILFADAGSPLVSAVKRAGARNIYCQPPFPADRTHAVDYHCSIFGAALPPVSDRIPSIVLRGIPGRAPEENTRAPAVAVSPGSGNARKNWPYERFVELSRLLEDSGTAPCWIVGPAEEAFPAPPSRYRVLRDLPAVELARKLARCRLYVGNDSGVSHLAAATGCPSIALFGPSDSAVWRPRGEMVRVIDARPECGPCHGPGVRPRQCAGGCMAGIDVDRVFGACREMLLRPNPAGGAPG